MTVHSTNERAEQLMGRRRTDVVAFDLPADLGYQCPVHRIVDDEHIHWSEYNGFIWCETCDRDYPSVLCIDLTAVRDPDRVWVHAGIDAAIDTYLNTVAAAVAHATSGTTHDVEHRGGTHTHADDCAAAVSAVHGHPGVDHIWLSAVHCRPNPSDDFAAQVGRAVIAKVVAQRSGHVVLRFNVS